jgi:hypothetical protein
MASFDFTSSMLDEGTTIIFGFWIRIANGSGGFNSHLAETSKPEAPAATPCSDFDEFIEDVHSRCDFNSCYTRISLIGLNPISGGSYPIPIQVTQSDLNRPRGYAV